MWAAAAVMLILYVAMGYRAYDLQVKESDRFRLRADKQHFKNIKVLSTRGDIKDRNGYALAISAPAPSIIARPKQIKNVAKAALALANILQLDARTLEPKLAKKRWFLWIRRHVSEDIARKIIDAKIKGIEIIYEPKRSYPGGQLAGSVLGLVDIDGKGLGGIERTQDSHLASRSAKFSAVRDAAGRVLAPVHQEKLQPGATIQLTIDKMIQAIAEEAIRTLGNKHKPKAASIVVLDVQTSEVLAMSNWPPFDPNTDRTKIKNSTNHAVTSSYEIGSPIKIFTLAAALEEKAIRPDQKISVHGGKFRIGSKLVTDTHEDWTLDPIGIIKRSSNVGAAKLAIATGIEPMREWFHKFGLGQKTGIELAGETSGILRKASRWKQIDLVTASYGYYLMVSPIQLATAFAMIGNEGMYTKPTLLRSVEYGTGSSDKPLRPRPKRVLSRTTASYLQKAMAAVFERGPNGGTAGGIRVNGFSAGGKTGTAHKVDPQTRRYSRSLYVSSFAGLAPIKHPRIAITVVVDEPSGGKHYGSSVAGPAFAEVASRTLRYLGVRSDMPITSDTVHSTNPTPPLPVDIIAKTDLPIGNPDDITIPDFRGLGIAESLDLAYRSGITLQIEGSGRAVQQFPPAGPHAPPISCRVVFSPNAQQLSNPQIQITNQNP